MKNYLFSLITFLCVNVPINAQTPNSGVITNVSAAKFDELIKADNTPSIIDLRTDKEIEKGFIPGAVQIDYLGKTFDDQLTALDKNKTYYIYCQAGGRSADAAEYMEKQGFKKIVNLEKGFSDWKAKGLPIDTK